MRLGQNPAKAKGSPAYQPTKIAIVSLTYAPTLEGYFREALEVYKVHFASLRASLDQDADLFVFDNGSCPEVVRFLQEQFEAGLIDWLHLSHYNMGKNGALNWLFGAIPNEYIVFSDPDVFFRKGWLEESLKLFANFPKAGLVSAQPVFFDFLRGQGLSTGQIREYGNGFRVEMVRPRQDIVDEYCDGINTTDELRQQFREKEAPVAVNEQTGVRAFIVATDMQFMLRREMARDLVPLPFAGALDVRDEIELPRGVEKRGYWLLSTAEPLVWHMGNSLQSRDLPEIERLRATEGTGSTPAAAPASMPTGFKSSLRRAVRRNPTLKRLAERAYGGLFGLLYEERK
jgi:hypothetical protein